MTVKWPVENPLHSLDIESYFAESEYQSRHINNIREQAKGMVEGALLLGMYRKIGDDEVKKIDEHWEEINYIVDDRITEEELKNKYNAPKNINEAIEKAKEIIDNKKGIENIEKSISSYFEIMWEYRWDNSVKNTLQLFDIIIKDENILLQERKIVNMVSVLYKNMEVVKIREAEEKWWIYSKVSSEKILINWSDTPIYKAFHIIWEDIVEKKIIPINEETFKEITENQWGIVTNILKEYIENFDEVLWREDEFYVFSEESGHMIKITKKI